MPHRQEEQQVRRPESLGHLGTRRSVVLLMVGCKQGLVWEVRGGGVASRHLLLSFNVL